MNVSVLLKCNRMINMVLIFGTMLQGEMTKEKYNYLMSYIKAGYKEMAFNNPAYHRLFELLLRNDGYVYFHCTAGKDRTGVAGFLIMIDSRNE